MTQTFFTSDTHFSHDNIRKYCNRPFSSVTEMNEILIENWNKVVGIKDKVYHLGDFSFAQPKTSDWILSRLNGQKFLLLGNHDKKRNRPTNTSLFTDLGNYYKLTIQDHELDCKKIDIILCHYPFETWDKKHWGSLCLCGHCHGTLSPMKNRLDVGIDNAKKLLGEYRPFSYNEVKEWVVRESSSYCSTFTKSRIR